MIETSLETYWEIHSFLMRDGRLDPEREDDSEALQHAYLGGG